MFPTSGSVRIDNKEITQMDEDELTIFRRRNVGMIYQFYNLIPTLNTEENIMLPWLLDGRKENRKKLTEIMEALGLSKRAKHLPSEMSGRRNDHEFKNKTGFLQLSGSISG